ncbi:MAG: peptidylprolyl isomerase [Bacteroidaceae bacterium]|nr:peptidylprolyl isomerase [Bacteroidaceae bacterium]
MDYELTKRLSWLDALRGFTMILVVAYHVAQVSFQETEKTSAALPFLVLMRMPLFFFVSGFLAYKASFSWTIPNALKLTWKKFKVQVIPTAVFLCLFVIFRMKGDFLDGLLRLLASPTKGGYWFTWVLLQMFIIYYIICYVGKSLTPSPSPRRGVLLLIAWAVSVFAYETLYLPKVFTYHKDVFFAYSSLIQTIRYMQFFLLGNIVRRYWTQVERLFDSAWFFPFVVTLAVVCCADIFQLHTLRTVWTNLPRTIAMYSLLLLVVMFFRHYQTWFDEGKRAGRFLSFIGTRTLDIYLLHFLLLPKMPQVGAWLNANQPNFLLSIVLSVSVALVVIAFCLLASQLLRVSPFLQLYLFGKAPSPTLPRGGGMLLLVALLCFGTLSVDAKKKEKCHVVRIETSMGNIRVALSDDTPLHSKNFLKLAREGFYDGTLFHRCIKDFMIQGGDPDSRGAEPGKLLGEGNVGYTIPAEFCLPYWYHWRGALAAAREPDDVNPEMESSGCQFYIVYGKKQAAADIRKVRAMLEEKGIELTPQMIDDYYMRGGTPHLDGQYTVFGEVIEGMDVVKSIQQTETDENNRPLKDVVILHMVVEQ